MPAPHISLDQWRALTAVVDAGYEGRLVFLLSVLNPHGFRLQRDARIAQLVAFTLAAPATEGYQGMYQGT